MSYQFFSIRHACHLNPLCLGIVVMVAVTANIAIASPLMLAGSELNASPASWVDSYYPLASTFSRAFPFSVVSGGPYSVEELQIVAFHHQNLAGKLATFSLHEDSQGEPGVELTDFQVHGISTVAQIHTATPSKSILLEADALYWIVGRTTQGQVNWNLRDFSTLGPTAFLRQNALWVAQDNRNLAAFAILGSPVPEPASLFLVGMIALGKISSRLPCQARQR